MEAEVHPPSCSVNYSWSEPCGCWNPRTCQWRGWKEQVAIRVQTLLPTCCLESFKLTCRSLKCMSLNWTRESQNLGRTCKLHMSRNWIQDLLALALSCYSVALPSLPSYPLSTLYPSLPHPWHRSAFLRSTTQSPIVSVGREGGHSPASLHVLPLDSP